MAFGNCGKLRTLTFHKNVQKIGLGAFLNCSELLICAPKDSEALKCAKKRGIRHRAILDEPEESGILGALERSALGQSALGQWIREKFEEQD